MPCARPSKSSTGRPARSGSRGPVDGGAPDDWSSTCPAGRLIESSVVPPQTGAAHESTVDRSAGRDAPSNRTRHAGIATSPHNHAAVVLRLTVGPIHVGPRGVRDRAWAGPIAPVAGGNRLPLVFVADRHLATSRGLETVCVDRRFTRSPRPPTTGSLPLRGRPEVLLRRPWLTSSLGLPEAAPRQPPRRS